jgi:hypothetical protein
VLTSSSERARVCGLGLRDPDFWSNGFPVWAICGPYYRKTLVLGDVIFFVPKKWATRKAEIEDCVCTGILVVARTLPSSEDVMADPQVDTEYKKGYKSDLVVHLKRDRVQAPRTEKIRSHALVLGDGTGALRDME